MEIRTVPARTVSEKLLEIPKPPTTLWVRGTPAPEGTKYLAVVGSRALTPYGKEACKKLIAGLTGYPISIVSGLAIGADTVAHQAALKAGLHTIAVPGSGLGDEVIYPRSNRELAHDIVASGGLLVSEHPPEYRPQAFDFPSRNRIMVGMSDAVLVIEAAEKSGSLITARLASEYNRDLLCIPHRIGDPHGFAAELYLRLGAALVTKSDHILEALGLVSSMVMQGVLPLLTADEQRLYDALAEPKERDALLRSADLDEVVGASALIALELKGVVHEKFGLWRRV